MNRYFLISIIFLTFSCQAHIKWMSVTEATESKPAVIKVSEGAIPFIEGRKFFVDKVSITNEQGALDLHKGHYEIESSKSSYYIPLPDVSVKNSRIVLESGPVFKKAFSNSKKTRPNRIEFSRLVWYSNQDDNLKKNEFEKYYLNIVPDVIFPVRVGSIFRFKVYNGGHEAQNFSAVLFKKGEDKALDIPLSDSTGSFEILSAGEYYIATSYTEKINGFFKYPEANELHLFASLIFEVE